MYYQLSWQTEKNHGIIGNDVLNINSTKLVNRDKAEKTGWLKYYEVKLRLKENVSPSYFEAQKVSVHQLPTVVEKLKNITGTRSTSLSSTSREQNRLFISNFKKEEWWSAYLWWLQNRCKPQNTCRVISDTQWIIGVELPHWYENVL